MSAAFQLTPFEPKADKRTEFAPENFSPKREVLIPVFCPCPQREYPHELSVHALIRSESFHPQLKFRYPWSLCLSEREEMSTERRHD